MKKITYEKLRMINFKRFKNRTLEFDNVDSTIYGENETGKSSVADALIWLFFGKNAQDKKDFSVKTLDSDNNEIPKLDHTVELTVMIDDVQKVFSRTLKENWVKKRGHEHQTMEGNTTEYMINTVPMPKKDFDKEVNEILNETVFKIMADIGYFSSKMKWKDRREILLSIVGDVSDSDVLLSNDKLALLEEHLKTTGDIDSLKKSLQNQVTKIKKSIAMIPVRVDEVNRGIPVLPENFDTLKTSQNTIKKDIDTIESELNDVNQLIEDQSKKDREDANKVLEFKRERNQLENNLIAEAYKEKSDLDSELNKVNYKIPEVESLIKSYEGQVQNLTDSIESDNKTMQDLRDVIKSLNESHFTEPNRDDFKCTTCGQTLPDDNIENQIDTMRSSFESNKISKSNKINAKGKGLKQNVADNLNKKSNLLSKIEDKKSELQTLNNKKADLEIALKELTVEEIDVTQNEEYKTLTTQIEVLSRPKENDSLEPIVKVKKDKINELKEQLSEVEKALIAEKQIEKAKTRLQELEDEEKQLNTNLLALEKTWFLSEEFIKTKVDLLSSKVNDMFKYVKFKMFDQLINGGIEDCCEVLVDGVPYVDVNTAGQVNAGIDIINVLSKKYDISLPLVIDNRESISKILDTEAQVINLFKDESYKELTLKKEGM